MTFAWGTSPHSNLSSDILKNWTAFGSPSYGNVFIRNATYYYIGIYVKYDNYNGSVLLTASDGKIFIWVIASGVSNLRTI